jgi:hypothetical protein
VIVLEVLGLLGLVVVIQWLIGLPGEEDEEELAGFRKGELGRGRDLDRSALGRPPDARIGGAA